MDENNKKIYFRYHITNLIGNLIGQQPSDQICDISSHAYHNLCKVERGMDQKASFGGGMHCSDLGGLAVNN